MNLDTYTKHDLKALRDSYKKKILDLETLLEKSKAELKEINKKQAEIAEELVAMNEELTEINEKLEQSRIHKFFHETKRDRYIFIYGKERNLYLAHTIEPRKNGFQEIHGWQFDCSQFDSHSKFKPITQEEYFKAYFEIRELGFEVYWG